MLMPASGSNEPPGSKNGEKPKSSSCQASSVSELGSRAYAREVHPYLSKY